MNIFLPIKYKSAFEKIDFSEVESMEIIYGHEISIRIRKEDFKIIMVIITETISLQGMTDQNEVNGFGKTLYEIYDYLLQRKPSE